MTSTDVAEAITTIARASDGLRDGGTKLITLGGDHTIALPLLHSLHRDNGPISVLHFDARLDTGDTYFGAPFPHGTPFRRASEEGLLEMQLPPILAGLVLAAALAAAMSTRAER